MTVFHLVRHGQADVPQGELAGRRDFPLHPLGRKQVEALLPRLRREPVSRIYASPIRRTQETAHILAAGLGLPVETAPELVELEFGEWTGRQFRDLDASPAWRRFNSFRSGTRIPGGELFLEVQVRIVDLMLRLRGESPGQTLLLVTHGDVVRAALTWFLGMPADLLLRLDISTASTSVVRLDEDGAQVLGINWTGDLDAEPLRDPNH